MQNTETKWCAVYTRKSTDEGLDSAFNSLDAQYDACSAYVKSQVGMGWRLMAVASVVVFFFLFIQKDVAYFTKFGPIIQ
jgi:hypothetical protein